jgi:hypothetical protein
MLINFEFSGENILKGTQIRDSETAVEYLKFDYLKWRRFNVNSCVPSLWLNLTFGRFPNRYTANRNTLLSKQRIMFTNIDLQHFVIAALIHSYLTNQHLLLIICVITACNSNRHGPLNSTPAMYWLISRSECQQLHKMSSLRWYFIVRLIPTWQMLEEYFSLLEDLLPPHIPKSTLQSSSYFPLLHGINYWRHH